MDIYQNTINITTFKKHIEFNTPCIIKNFLRDNDIDTNNISCSNDDNLEININSKYSLCGINSFVNYIKSMDLNCVGYGCYNKNKDKEKLCCTNPFLEELINDPQFIFPDEKRYWTHDKDNFTRNHYDGNGIEVINISLKGKKRFYLSSSKKQLPMYPLSNLSLDSNPDDIFYDYIIDLEPGDLLYIPSYWWHKVITLENDTININFNFYSYNHKLSERQKNIFASHKLSGSIMWSEDPINKVVNLDNHSILTTLQWVLSECYMFILLSLILGYYISNYSKKYIILSVIILLIIKESSYLNTISYGYIKMILYFLIPVFIFGYTLGLYTHQHQT